MIPPLDTRLKIRRRLQRMGLSSKAASDGRGIFLGDGLPCDPDAKIRSNDLIALIDFTNAHDLAQFVAKGNTASMGRAGVEVIFNQYNLLEFLEFFDKNNKSNDAPYHNQYHSYCMVLNCYEGMAIEFPNVHENWVAGLLIGALMHDFNHTAGKSASDRVNIELALDGLIQAQQTVTNKLTEEQLKVAIGCILATEYPYARFPENWCERIIRDADLMSVYEHDEARLVAQYKGLWAEINKTRPMSFEEFLDKNTEFLSNVVWRTLWASEKAKYKWQSAIARLSTLS